MKPKILYYLCLVFSVLLIGFLTAANSPAQYIENPLVSRFMSGTNGSFPLAFMNGWNSTSFSNSSSPAPYNLFNNWGTTSYGLISFGLTNNFLNFNQNYPGTAYPMNFGMFSPDQLFPSSGANPMFPLATSYQQFNFSSPLRSSNFYSPQIYSGTAGSFSYGNTFRPDLLYGTGILNNWQNILSSMPAVQIQDENDSGESGGQTGSDVDQSTIRRKSLASLTPVTDCEALLAQLKADAIQEMEEKINENIEKVIDCGGCCTYYYPIYPAYPLYGYSYCSYSAATYAYSASYAPSIASLDAADAGTVSPPTESATEYSTTNTQVAGVDEADFIKNDGSYIYILAHGKFQIIDAWPPENASIISTADIEGISKKLYIANDRALIYSGLEHLDGWGNDDECTYGYNCDFTGDNRKLKITIFDISDRANPVLIREIRFGGSYINSRRVGSAVHTVIFSPALFSPKIKYWPELYDQCRGGYYPWGSLFLQPYIYGGYYPDINIEPTFDDRPTLDELLEAFDQLKDENRAIIENSTIADWVPGIQDTSYGPDGEVLDENLLYDCSNFYESEAPDKKSFLTIFSMDIDGTEDLHHVTIFGDPGAVYASSSALYISSRRKRNSGCKWFYSESSGIEEASTVHKFRLLNESTTGCEYAGSGVVKGKILNQFSMDEYEGYLRIATTTGHVPSPDVHSTMSILEESEDELQVIGQIDNIAPQEDIRSVRFNGPKGFIVTFKKTDPLFAFDLSDPTAPRIAGELKIPGYSTYMHLMDDEHLLTIGYDADDKGSFAWFQGIMLQIFDVTDMAAPCLLHKEIIGTRGSTSEAATNHLAFNYFAPKDLLAIPITICEGGSGGSYGTDMTFSGLIIYDVTVGNGFSEHGRVSHVEPGSETSCSICRNWWTDSNSIVKRSIFMDNYVFSVTADQIKFDRLDDMGQAVTVIDLQ